MKIRFLIAAIMILTMAAISFADGTGGAQLINETNRHLIGENGEVSINVYDKFNNLISGNEFTATEMEEIIVKSNIIDSAEKGVLVPQSVKEFVVDVKDGYFISPEIIASNGDMIILKTSDLDGWNLEKGEKLVFEVELYSTGKKQAIIYQVIIDGVLQNESIQLLGDQQKIEITAEREGDYCISLVNINSTYLAMKPGKIRIK